MPNIGLTDEIISELEGHHPFGNISDLIKKARNHDGAACRQLIELSITLDKNDFDKTWCGSTPLVDVRKAYHNELIRIRLPQSSNKKHPSHISHVISKVIPSSKPPVPSLAQSSLPSWREIAKKANFPLKALSRSDAEILGMIDRVLVTGQGWGPKDPLRGKRTSISIIPSRMAKKGRKCNPRTYQRAIRNLQDLQLLELVCVNADNTRDFVPTWWTPGSPEKAIETWKVAKEIAENPNEMSDQSRTDVAPMSHSCRTSVAPPVPVINSLTPYVCNRIGPTGVRHYSRRLTSYFDILTLGHSTQSEFPSQARSSPCLPNRQARRWTSSKGEEYESE